MPAISGLMMFFGQSTDALSGSDVHWLMISAVVIALALVGQAVCVGVGVVFAAKMLKKIEEASDTLDRKTTPILSKTNALLDDLGPKIRSISSNAEQISYTVRAKVDEAGETLTQLNRTVADANIKTRLKVARVDDVVTGAVTTAAEVAILVEDGIRTPILQLAGLVAGLKAALATLMKRSPFGKKSRTETPYDL